MNEQERTALVLASLDAAIATLTSQRDLLVLALIGEMSDPAVEAREVIDGECQHARTTDVAVMGIGTRPFCIDCETVLE